MGLRRWLDPPDVRAHKRYLRAAGLHPGRGGLEVGLAIPIGCMVPFAIAAAVLVGAGVLVGTRLQAAAAPQRSTAWSPTTANCSAGATIRSGLNAGRAGTNQLAH